MKSIREILNEVMVISFCMGLATGVIGTLCLIWSGVLHVCN